MIDQSDVNRWTAVNGILMALTFNGAYAFAISIIAVFAAGAVIAVAAPMKDMAIELEVLRQLRDVLGYSEIANLIASLDSRGRDFTL
jgi:hypothetical protein